MAHNPILNSSIKGEGVPLLILHGYFGMSDNWKTLGNQFSENFQVCEKLRNETFRKFSFLAAKILGYRRGLNPSYKCLPHFWRLRVLCFVSSLNNCHVRYNDLII